VLFVELLDVFKELKRKPIVPLGADSIKQSRNHLHVMADDIRPAIKNLFQRFSVSLEVGN
jgi:hypothetical protein